MDKGLFIAIEGIEGQTKDAQYRILKKRLTESEYDLVEFRFPQYSEESSFFTREYLSGKYGNIDDVSPYVGSLFAALDRYHASFEIKKALSENKIVLCSNYTGCSMALQGVKFQNPEERRGYFIWLDNLEFQVMQLPRPDINFVLMESATEHGSQLPINSKKDKELSPLLRANRLEVKNILNVYSDLCTLFPKDFIRIDSIRSNRVLSDSDISDLIWKTLESSLPLNSKRKGKGNVMEVSGQVGVENPYIIRTEEGLKRTPEGENFLEEAVTNTSGNVYAFTDRLGSLTIAAAMARLSRNPHDMRDVILDEFAPHEGKDEDLLRRVITAYGDDSVQQLVGQHLVVEGASNLLTKQLEWGRLAAYLEQSTRYIYFDQKDKDGHFKYFTPEQLDKKTTLTYEKAMDTIFDAYSEMVHQLTDYLKKTSSTPEDERDGAWKAAIRAQACDAIRPVLPVATKSTVGIFASGQALEAMIMRLRSSESQEARETGSKLLEEARKVIPTFLERADKPDRGGATTAYLSETRSQVQSLAERFLPETHSSNTEAVNLVNATPRNELELVPHMLYESSTLSLEEIKKAVDTLSLADKTEIFNAYMGERLNRRHRPGRAIELAHYSWDLVCDYGIFRDLQRHRMVDELEWQALTPRYGYEIPRLVEEAGLSDLFEQCFDISAKLYSSLQAAGYEYEAQYATLLGHKMRWKVTYNAREAFHLHELRTSPQGHPGYRKLVNQMHEKLAEVHPLMAEAMKFVNRGEDPELARLAAERYTQFKLNQFTEKS